MKYGILDAAMTKNTSAPSRRRRSSKAAREGGVLADGHGHAGTVQERLKIKRGGKIIERPRLWVIDAEKFMRFLSKSGGNESGEP